MVKYAMIESLTTSNPPDLPSPRCLVLPYSSYLADGSLSAPCSAAASPALAGEPLELSRAQPPRRVLVDSCGRGNLLPVLGGAPPTGLAAAEGSSSHSMARGLSDACTLAAAAAEGTRARRRSASPDACSAATTVPAPPSTSRARRACRPQFPRGRCRLRRTEGTRRARQDSGAGADARVEERTSPKAAAGVVQK
jgi:hypothetical protein